MSVAAPMVRGPGSAVSGSAALGSAMFGFAAVCVSTGNRRCISQRHEEGTRLAMMGDRGLLAGVADAVASGEDVDWERCAERAGPGERRVLRNLRTLAGIGWAAGLRPGRGLSRSLLNFASGGLPVFWCLYYATSATTPSGGASASRAPTRRCRSR